MKKQIKNTKRLGLVGLILTTSLTSGCATGPRYWAGTVIPGPIGEILKEEDTRKYHGRMGDAGNWNQNSNQNINQKEEPYTKSRILEELLGHIESARTEGLINEQKYNYQKNILTSGVKEEIYPVLESIDKKLNEYKEEEKIYTDAYSALTRKGRKLQREIDLKIKDNINRIRLKRKESLKFLEEKLKEKNNGEKIEELKKLKELQNLGVITEEQYQEKAQPILNELGF